MSPQAVLRIAKIKSWQALKGCANHNRRGYEVPNADPTGQISFLVSSSNLDIVETAKEKIGNQHIRKNAVLAVETVLSASAAYFRPEAPEAFGTWSEPKLETWKQASFQWLNDKLGDRLLEVALHLDEGTPHMHCLWVPLDDRGKLSYFRTEFGGNKSSLSKIQDSYAKTLAPLGIERGIKKSKAFHQHIQKYYQAVNQASLNMEDINQLFPQPEPEEDASHYRARTISTLAPTLETMQAQLVHRQWVIQEKEQEHTKALRSEKERQRLEKRLEELESSQPPVEEVAYELGFDPDSKSKQWKRGNDTIEIVENAWRKPGESTHGAVDFVMEFGGYNFKKSVAWLAERFGTNEMVGAVREFAISQALDIAHKESPPAFELPQPSEANWEKVHNYLVENLNLSLEIVSALHRKGLVYADNEGAAIFPHRQLESGDTESPKFNGATRLKPNRECQLVAGSKRREGCFWIGIGSAKTLQSVAIASSPKELLTELSRRRQANTLYMVADERNLPETFLHQFSIVDTVPGIRANSRLSTRVQQFRPIAPEVAEL